MTCLWSTRTPTPKSGPVMPGIVAAIAAENGLTVADLLGPSQKRAITNVRQEAFWRCRQYKHLSLPQIGRFFNRDHTTVLHGVRVHKQRLSQLPLIPDVQNGYETMKAHEG